MSQLTQILRESINPSEIIGPRLIEGPEGVVDWEYGTRPYRALKKDDLFCGLHLIVGDVVFVDHKRRRRLRNTILEENAIYLDWFEVGRLHNLVYTATTIVALSHVDFENQTVFDVGSGSGILSMYSLKQGADSVFGLDKNNYYGHNFMQNIKHNGFSDRDIVWTTWSINSLVDTLKEKRAGYGVSDKLDEVNIVFSNMGPLYPGYLGSIEVLDYTPQTHTFVGGGFNNLERMKPDTAIAELEKRGFSGYKEYSSKTKDGVKVIAFTMKKTK